MTKLYSLENLNTVPRKLRDLTESEIRQFYVKEGLVTSVFQSDGITQLNSLYGSVSLPNSTLESDMQRKINSQIGQQESDREDARCLAYETFSSAKMKC